MAKPCPVKDIECLPAIPCEREEGHVGPHYRTHAKDIPNHPNPGGRVYFTGTDVLNETTAKLWKMVAIGNAAQQAEIEAKKSAEAAEKAKNLQAELEALQDDEAPKAPDETPK